LLDRGCRRLAMIMHELWLPSDSLYHDGIRRALREAEENHGGIVIRGVPSATAGMDMVSDMIAQLLEQEDRPTGLICRGPAFAEAALRVAAEVGLKVPDDLEIVFDHWTYRSQIGLPHACPLLPYRDIVAMIGGMVTELMDGRRPESEHALIDVQLVGKDGERIEIAEKP
jgi:LacI family transcriptional regulator